MRYVLHRACVVFALLLAVSPAHASAEPAARPAETGHRLLAEDVTRYAGTAVQAAAMAGAPASGERASTGVPSAANSTCPTTVTAAPDGNCCFDVIVRDLANNPLAGSLVVVDFGACTIDFCPTQPPGVTINVPSNTARVLTDASGHAHICVCIRNSIATCTPAIFADGVQLCALLPALSCPSDSACVPEAWHTVATSTPSARFASAMASDYDYERVVLFGGNAGGVALQDTWRWDGLDWTALSPVTHPGPRYQHAMAYDRARRRIVLFGGTDGVTPFGDTWEFDGANWALVSTSGPSPRYGHGLTYDELHGRIVLFGGSNGTELGDTWEWDGTTWTQTATTGPLARHGAGFAYDYASGVVMLYGGTGSSGTLGDMWAYSSGNWIELPLEPGNPSVRTGLSMAFSPEGNMMVLYGGTGSGADASTYAWKGGQWERTVPGVGPRVDAAMAYDHFNDHIMIFGGRDNVATLTGRSDTWEWCSPCSFVSALLDTVGQVIPPANADLSVWNDQTIPSAPSLPVSSLFPQFNTTNDNWHENYPCDPAFGAEDSLDLGDPYAEIRDSLGTPDFNEQDLTDSLTVWEQRINDMMASEPGAFADSLPIGGTYTSPTQAHCPDPTKRYAFGGRDIVFVHGLRMTPLKQRMFGTNDTAFVDWQPTGGTSSAAANPDYYQDARYWKRGANNYWKPHIDRFLRAKGYANRFIVVAWPATQRYETGVNAVLSQIADAMRDGTGVIDSLSGHNDTSKFGTPSFVVISHSTGGPLVDVAMSAAANLPALQAKFIADHCKAHIALEGAFSGSAIAATAVGAGAVLSDNGPVWLCKLLEWIFESNVPVCHNIAYLDTPIRGVTFDLSPNVSQIKWGWFMDNIKTRTVTITGGHPTFQWPLKWLLLRGLDDGVLNTNSTSANPTSRFFWPSGYERLGPRPIAGRAVRDRGINDGFKRRRSRGYAHDQMLDPVRSLDPINILFPPPLFTRVATGNTDYLSPTGMVQPWHFKSRGGLLDSNKRYGNHFSFIESASDHYGVTPNAVDDVRDASAIKQLNVFFPDNDYERTFSLAGTEHNKEEVRVITDDRIYDRYTMLTDTAPLLDRNNGTVMAGIDVIETPIDKCFPKRKNKPCKMYRWRRKYDQLVGWQNKLGADYAYDYLLTEPAETCISDVSAGDGPGEAVFYARSSHNPFTRDLAVDFQLPRAGTVNLDIYDMQGRRVRALVGTSFAAGAHRVLWDGRTDAGMAAQPGVYFWRFRLDGKRVAGEKAVLVR